MTIDNSMQGKAVLVTGAARRVGAEIVRTLHQAGANVGIHYHQSARDASLLAEALNARRAHSAHPVRFDLADVDGFPGLLAEVAEHFGRLDGLVNNASGFFATPMGRITNAHWNTLVDYNLKAVYESLDGFVQAHGRKPPGRTGCWPGADERAFAGERPRLHWRPAAPKRRPPQADVRNQPPPMRCVLATVHGVMPIVVALT